MLPYKGYKGRKRSVSNMLSGRKVAFTAMREQVTLNTGWEGTAAPSERKSLLEEHAHCPAEHKLIQSDAGTCLDQRIQLGSEFESPAAACRHQSFPWRMELGFVPPGLTEPSAGQGRPCEPSKLLGRLSIPCR